MILSILFARLFIAVSIANRGAAFGENVIFFLPEKRGLRLR
jgi:hypothetical protein